MAAGQHQRRVGGGNGGNVASAWRGENCGNLWRQLAAKMAAAAIGGGASGEACRHRRQRMAALAGGGGAAASSAAAENNGMATSAMKRQWAYRVFCGVSEI